MTIFIHALCPRDEEQFLSAMERSPDLFENWVNPPSTPDRLSQQPAKCTGDENRSFLAKTQNGELVGCINLNEIVRGTLQSAYLGYYAFAPNNRKGLMKKAMAALIKLAFTELELHRLEANIQPYMWGIHRTGGIAGIPAGGLFSALSKDRWQVAGS